MATAADLAEEGLLEDEPEEFDDLPAFANDVNKQLHAQVREREKVLAQTEVELADTKERIGVMEGHLGSVKTEQLHTQRLVDAKIKEIETEDHLKQLAERERGRFHAEFKKLSDEIAELQARALVAAPHRLPCSTPPAAQSGFGLALCCCLPSHALPPLRLSHFSHSPPTHPHTHTPTHPHTPTPHTHIHSRARPYLIPTRRRPLSACTGQDQRRAEQRVQGQRKDGAVQAADELEPGGARAVGAGGAPKGGG